MAGVESMIVPLSQSASNSGGIGCRRVLHVKQLSQSVRWFPRAFASVTHQAMAFDALGRCREVGFGDGHCERMGCEMKLLDTERWLGEYDLDIRDC
jgi:hypothetical protein